MKKAALYVRVSSSRQVEEGHSLDEQQWRLREEAERRGYEVVKVYSENGVSGRSVRKRHVFQEMMGGVRYGDYDAIFVTKLSRFARSVKDTIVAVEELQRYGVDLICLEHNIDTTSANGKLFLNMLAAFAQYYSDQLSDQIKDAYRYADQRGGRVGMVPYGYRHDDDGLLEKDDYEQSVIRKICEMTAAGVSRRGVCSALEDGGYRNRRGEVSWNLNVVQRIIARYCK